MMYELSGAARKRAPFAISCVAGRARGIWDISLAWRSSSSLLASPIQRFQPSVAVEPGAIPLTKMPCGASSSAIERVRFTTPAFAATYELCSRIGTSPRTDAILMILPERSDFICGMTARLMRKTPVRSIRSISSQVSIGNSSMVLRSAAFTPIPALLTRMSMPSGGSGDFTHDGFNLIAVRHVEGVGKVPCFRNWGDRHGFSAVIEAKICECDPGTIRRERVRNGTADALRRAGNQRDLTLKVDSHGISPLRTRSSVGAFITCVTTGRPNLVKEQNGCSGVGSITGPPMQAIGCRRAPPVRRSCPHREAG